MKKIKIYSIFFIVVLSFLISCSHSEKEDIEYVQLDNLNFGEGIYRPNPFKFLDNVPPFVWMGMPDSVSKSTNLRIAFNEDAVRSKSEAYIVFTDTQGNIINGDNNEIYGLRILRIKADSINQDYPLNILINPHVGNKMLKGNIMVSTSDLDSINNVSLTSTDYKSIGQWSLNHQIGINWWRWLIFIIIIIFLCVCLYFLIYGLIYILGNIKINFIPSKSYNNQSKEFSNKKEDKRKNKKEKKDKEKLHPYLRDRQQLLKNPITAISTKAKALEESIQFLDYDIINIQGYHKEVQFNLLDSNIQNALNDLWDPKERNFYRAPKNYGKWSGEAKNSIWIPDDYYTPPNKSYSNINNLSWREIKRKYSFKGLEFRKGKPVFKNLAKYSVALNDFANYIDPEDSAERFNLHMAAFSALASKLNTTVEAVKKIKEENILVWHEDTDCKTMYLVPQEIHGNIIHFGGISMLYTLRSNNLI